MNLKNDEIYQELLCYYKEDDIINIKNNRLELKKIFKNIIKENSKEYEIEDLFNNINDNVFLIDTPDDYQLINDFFIKQRQCFKLLLDDDIELECSFDHKIETTSGWKFAKDLSKIDLIKTKNGYLKLIDKCDIGENKVYDFEIDHKNHRYWSNDISSHNTAKTFVTCYYALSCLKDHKFEKIILTKPVQEAGENLGFLPGTIDEKIAPHYESYRSTFLKMVDAPTLERNYKNGIIENKPLAFMRGASFENCLIIGDEFQNADIRSLIMFITRMGKGSKIIICGDISQYDIDKQYIALDYLPKLIGDIPGVGTFTFTEDDIMRHSILIEITKRYELAKSQDSFPKKKKQ